ncbi:acetylornithine deacetylase [Maritalea mediterranea]|uniref:Acetylornithine deacetylase n=1 Tax=Maritalea mediterranea TaxID=2909667 RepID=A0ABS9E310_9HYPH|nr:acetylornithine deacetylase [Maritalea mediterranea]MCF4097249.1 acetylornithine deacetylase [Maritalea mediterranea]
MLDRTEEILRQLIAFPTVSADSNLDMIHYVANLLEDVGAKIELHHDATHKKANLVATIGPDIGGGIVLSGHSDVVPVADQTWQTDPFELVEKDGRYFGRGTCDMKGFIAAALALAPKFAAHELKRPVHFIFTYDEEVGCLGARDLVEILRHRPHLPAAAIVGEPTMMKIVEGHKGCCEYSVFFTGRAGHGSRPEAGVNAAEYATRYVSKLLELREALKQRAPKNSPFDPPWTTINVGRIEGGSAHNVICNHTEVDWEMRPIDPADADWVKDILHTFCSDELLPDMRKVWPDSNITTRTIGEVIGLTPVQSNEAREIVAALTGQNDRHYVAFGTEAGLFQDLGVATIVCGPGSIEQAHKPDEFLDIGQMQQCLTMLDKLAHSMRA